MSGPQHSNEHFEKAQKEMKREYHQRDQKRQESSTTATKVNAVQTKKPHQNKKKKQDCSNKAPHDTGQIKYFNYQKFGYYANTCPKLKNQFWSR